MKDTNLVLSNVRRLMTTVMSGVCTFKTAVFPLTKTNSLKQII